LSIFSDINNSISGNAYRWITPLKEVTGMVQKGYVLASDGRQIPQTDRAAAFEVMDQAMACLKRRDDCIRRIKKLQADPIAMASPEGNERQTSLRMAWLKSYQSFAILLKFAAELYERHGYTTATITPKMQRDGTLAFRDVSWTDWRSDKSTADRAGYVINRGGKLYVFNQPREWVVFADEQLVKLRDMFGLGTRDGAEGTLKGGTMGEPITGTAAVVLYCVIAVSLAVVVVAVMHHMNIQEVQEVSKQEMAQVDGILASAQADDDNYARTGDPKYLVSAQAKRDLALAIDENRTERDKARASSLDPFAGLSEAFKGASTLVAAVSVAAILYFAAPYLLAFLKSRKGGEA
jgi:hypothetical protein